MDPEEAVLGWCKYQLSFAKEGCDWSTLSPCLYNQAAQLIQCTLGGWAILALPHTNFFRVVLPHPFAVVQEGTAGVEKSRCSNC